MTIEFSGNISHFGETHTVLVWMNVKIPAHPHGHHIPKKYPKITFRSYHHTMVCQLCHFCPPTVYIMILNPIFHGCWSTVLLAFLYPVNPSDDIYTYEGYSLICVGEPPTFFGHLSLTFQERGNFGVLRDTIGHPKDSHEPVQFGPNSPCSDPSYIQKSSKVYTILAQN